MSIIDYFRPKTKAKIMRGEPVPWIDNNKRGAYIRRCVLSYPSWVSKKELKKLWTECRELEKVKGIPYTLGHIIPLSHPRVSGLSVPWNLQPEPADLNFAKGNAWCEYRGELFDMPEQFNLF